MTLVACAASRRIPPVIAGLLSLAGAAAARKAWTAAAQLEDIWSAAELQRAVTEQAIRQQAAEEIAVIPVPERSGAQD